jgi:hypothetical protein
MRKSKSAASKISAPSIDDIDAENTPSLAGFWKCDETSGDQILDYSGYGNHLIVTNTNLGSPNDSFESIDQAQSFKSGWFSMVKGTKAEIAASGILDTGSNFVVAHAEYYVHSGFNDFWDFDTGTAHDFEETNDTYQGFTLAGAVAQGVWCRVAAGTTDKEDTTIRAISSRTNISLAGGFKPSTSVLACLDGGALDSTASARASLTAQDGKFGFGPSSSRERVSLRNYQIWSFASEPVYMDETIEWLSHNPSKIPPWWVGR